MSCNYAEGLSPYHDKGQLGLEEKFDSKSVISSKVSLLTKWLNEANHVVVHTGAGISTAAGIPDFRGPKGVWTLEAKGEKPDLSKDFNEAVPTITHMAIMKLVEKQKVKYVVSQNIDGLHLRSNLQRKHLSELHGNMFTEQCNSCNKQFVRSTPVPTVGQKSLNKGCPSIKANGRPCRGRLHDTILDWEHNLPENDLGMADYHSCLADLSICLGTTMQIVPSGNLPLYTKRHGGKLVIVNLQPTKHDKKANLIIHAYVDEVMTMLMKNLNLKIPKYAAKNDPTRNLPPAPSEKYLEWTISDYAVKKMKKIYESKCGSKEARKRLEMIYDDVPLDVLQHVKRKTKDEDDSDLEILDVMVKPKKAKESRKTSRKNSRSSSSYSTTITIKKVGPPSPPHLPPPKKIKYNGEKITIKKNVTPTKTKYEIVTKPKRVAKCEIVYCTDGDVCNDLDMICESDDEDEGCPDDSITCDFQICPNDDENKEETNREVLRTGSGPVNNASRVEIRRKSENCGSDEVDDEDIKVKGGGDDGDVAKTETVILPKKPENDFLDLAGRLPKAEESEPENSERKQIRCCENEEKISRSHISEKPDRKNEKSGEEEDQHSLREEKDESRGEGPDIKKCEEQFSHSTASNVNIPLEIKSEKKDEINSEEERTAEGPSTSEEVEDCKMTRDENNVDGGKSNGEGLTLSAMRETSSNPIESVAHDFHNKVDQESSHNA